MSDRYVGLDLGQVSDYTALAVLRRDGVAPKPAYGLEHLQRVRGMAYVGTPQAPGVVEAVKARLVAEPALCGCHMAVDRTGVGRPVVDAFRAAGLPCALWAVTLTAGQDVRQEGLDLWVPKKDLVGAAQALLSSGRLVLDSKLSLAETLRTELKNFAVKVTAAGNETFASWREGQHDDLVFAVALACWLAERFPPFVRGSVVSGGRMAMPRGVFGGAAGRAGGADARRMPAKW
jgi:hypothetical protein